MCILKHVMDAKKHSMPSNVQKRAFKISPIIFAAFASQIRQQNKYYKLFYFQRKWFNKTDRILKSFKIIQTQYQYFNTKINSLCHTSNFSFNMQLNPTIRSFNTFQNKFPLGVLEFNKYNKNLPNSELKIGDFSKIQEKVQSNGFSHAMDLVHNDFAMDEFQLSEVETIMSLQDGNESTISLDFESESEFFDSPNSSYCYNSSKTSMI